MKSTIKKVGTGLVAGGTLAGALIIGKQSGEALGHQQGLQEGIAQEASACINHLSWRLLGSIVLTPPEAEAILKDPAQPPLPLDLYNDLRRPGSEDIRIVGFGVEGLPRQQAELDKTNATIASNLVTIEDALIADRQSQSSSGDTFGLNMSYGKGGDPNSAFITIHVPQC